MRNLISDIQLAPKDGFRGIGPLGLQNYSLTSAPKIFNTFLSSLVGIITVIAIIWFLVTLITGALAIMSAGGDKAALENARKRIATGLIGLIVTISALFILDLIGSLIGIKDILNPAALLDSITK